MDAFENQMTRRGFLELSGAAAAAWNLSSPAFADSVADPQLQEAISKLEYLTPLDRAFILDKGKADVGKLPPEKLREIGLVPETWTLEVLPDPASNCAVARSFARSSANALDWSDLMRLAEKHSIRFMHVCTCTNGPNPFHMSLWEGIPLREVILLTKPQENVPCGV
jgi:hypothetical protein